MAQVLTNAESGLGSPAPAGAGADPAFRAARAAVAMNRSSSRESFPALPTTAHREWREALAAGTDDAMREETKEAGDAGKPVAKDEPLIGIAATPGLFKVSDAPAGARDVEPVPGLSATPDIFKPSVPIHVIEAEERARGAVPKTPPRSPAPPGEAPTTPARRSLFRSFKRSPRNGEAEPRARSKSTPPPRSPGADMRSPAEITFRPAGALFTHGDDVLPPQGGGARPAGEAVDTLAGTSLRSVCDDLETGDGFAAIFAAADAADCDRKQLEQLWAEHDKALALVTKARSESEEDESSGAIESAARNLDELKRAIERLQAGRAKVETLHATSKRVKDIEIGGAHFLDWDDDLIDERRRNRPSFGQDHAIEACGCMGAWTQQGWPDEEEPATSAADGVLDFLGVARDSSVAEFLGVAPAGRRREHSDPVFYEPEASGASRFANLFTRRSSPSACTAEHTCADIDS